MLVVVTGVAGSGKSSLINGSVTGLEGVVSVDQGAIKGSRRSNPATYTGLLDPIRKAFAKANGVKPALFSANSEGACPNCNGAGVIYTDLAMMAGVATPCEVCDGKRFQAEVLEYTLGGQDISEVLAMPVSEAEDFFGVWRGARRLPPTRSSLDSSTSGSGTSASVSLCPRCPVANGSGSSWPPPWQTRVVSTFSTSPPPVFTSPTSNTCSGCSIGSWTPGSQSSLSHTTRHSWPTQTGSSTLGPALGTTAARSSSREHLPTSSAPGPPSQASISLPTSAPDEGARRHPETGAPLQDYPPVIGALQSVSTARRGQKLTRSAPITSRGWSQSHFRAASGGGATTWLGRDASGASDVEGHRG